MAAKTFFISSPKNANMLISVKMAQTLSIFFSHQKMHLTDILYKKRGRKISMRFNRRCKNEVLGESGPPLCT